MSIRAMAPSQPMGVGRLLDQAVRLYRGNFLTFVGIIAVVQIPLTVLQFIISLLAADAATASAFDPAAPSFDEVFGGSFLATFASSILVLVLSVLLLQGVATAALTRAIADRYLGESTSMIEAYSRIGSSWVHLIGALIFMALLFLGLGIWTILPCVGWFTGPGILAFFALAVFPLIAPVVVLERARAFAAIRRAWDLARRRFWWVLGFMFALTLFAQIIISGPATLVGVIVQFALGDPLSTSDSQVLIQSVVQAMVQLTVSLVYLPLQLTAVTLVYFDLRVRTEGFDLALLARGETDQPTDFAALTRDAPTAAIQKLITGREVLYFALLTVAAVGLYFILISLFVLVSMALFGALGGT